MKAKHKVFIVLNSKHILLHMHHVAAFVSLATPMLKQVQPYAKTHLTAEHTHRAAHYPQKMLLYNLAKHYVLLNYTIFYIC